MGAIALKKTKEAYELAKSLNQLLFIMAISAVSMAVAYDRLKQYDEAIKYYKESAWF